MTQEWFHRDCLHSKSCLHNQEDHTVDKRSQEMQTSLNMLETEDSSEGITYKN